MIFLIVGLPTLRKKLFKFLTLKFMSAPGNSTTNLFLYGHKNEILFSSFFNYLSNCFLCLCLFSRKKEIFELVQ